MECIGSRVYYSTKTAMTAKEKMQNDAVNVPIAPRYANTGRHHSLPVLAGGA